MGETRCGACGRKTRFKGDGTPYKHACKAEPRRVCTQSFGNGEDCGEPVTTPGAFRCDDHIRCSQWDDCGECWEPVSEPVCAHRYVWVDAPNGGPSGMFCEHCSDEQPAEASDPFFDGLIAAGLVVPGDSAETHRRMLAGKPCHNGPSCRYCNPVSEPAVTVPSMDDKPKTEADAFLDPTTPVSGPLGDQEPLRDQYKRYLLPHPVTGLYSDGKPTAGRRNGWMRATTFAKAAADTFALTRYNERLTLVGATLRPDVVALAHGKDVREHRNELDKLVDEIKNAAGAKVAANLGTAVHAFTERIDAGTLTLAEVPEQYRRYVEAYLTALRVNGMECVPGLIERTTFTSEFNVAGTFDRVYRLPDGTYAIGDLKTGRDLKYGQMEIAVQLALYAHGINANGVFDWGTGEWYPNLPHCACVVHLSNETCAGPIRVRTDVGVVVHLPVQGDLAGRCVVKTVDLRAGWTAALTAERVIRDRKGDYMRDGLYMPPVERPKGYWIDQFSSVTSRDEANRLYRQAKAAGLSADGLAAMVAIGKASLENAARGL
jgi:hypothetical protein